MSGGSPWRRLRDRPATWTREPAMAALAVIAVLAAVDADLTVRHAERRHAAHRSTAAAATRGSVPVPATVRAAEAAAVAAARRRVPAMFTYDYRQADAYLASAPTNTTGAFTAQFTHLLRSVTVPAARKKEVTSTARIRTVAVVPASTDGADEVHLLVFLDLTTTSRVSRNGRVEADRARVVMTRTGTTWLVSDLAAI